MKTAFYILGAGLIIGGVAVAIYSLHDKIKKEHDVYHERKEAENEESSAVDAPLTIVTPIQNESVYEYVKTSAIGSIYSRHEDATAIIMDSVETIRENVKVSDNTNSEIDEVSAKLDKMLSED